MKAIEAIERSPVNMAIREGDACIAHRRHTEPRLIYNGEISEKHQYANLTGDDWQPLGVVNDGQGSSSLGVCADCGKWTCEHVDARIETLERCTDDQSTVIALRDEELKSCYEQLKELRQQVANVSAGCKYDTDGDGNCHKHPHGCYKAKCEEVAELEQQVADYQSGKAFVGREADCFVPWKLYWVENTEDPSELLLAQCKPSSKWDGMVREYTGPHCYTLPEPPKPEYEVTENKEHEPTSLNVCAIRSKGGSTYWENNNEHGSGWTDRIRQAWTYREALIEAREVVSQYTQDWEIVELSPGEIVPPPSEYEDDAEPPEWLAKGVRVTIPDKPEGGWAFRTFYDAHGDEYVECVPIDNHECEGWLATKLRILTNKHNDFHLAQQIGGHNETAS